MGRQTFIFRNRPEIVSAASVVGNQEGKGPLGHWFDLVSEDDTFGEKTWEKSESRMLETAVDMAVKEAGMENKDVDILLSGDLLNQIMSSSFMARNTGMPFIGLYGACSTMTESLMMAAVLVDGGYCRRAVNCASSHFCSAERQFRMPLEHGNQKPPCAPSTVIGAGAMMVGCREKKKKQTVTVTSATAGKIIDTGIKDSNEMGAAMAPAAVDTILTHLQDTGRSFHDYDLIITGDLGFTGKAIAEDLLKCAGIEPSLIEEKFEDCGTLIYDKEDGFEGGGSGCGCSASVFAGYIYKRLKKGELKRVLLLSTGALLSTISSFQGESIPGIAHGVVLEVEEEQ